MIRQVEGVVRRVGRLGPVGIGFQEVFLEFNAEDFGLWRLVEVFLSHFVRCFVMLIINPSNLKFTKN